MHRKPDHDIDPLFVRRWSPRSMTGEAIALEELLRLFEAARWSPSSSNRQPWRFVYALAGTPTFEPFVGLLAPANAAWARKAGALVVVVAKTTTDDGKPSRLAASDTGAAWMALALQGTVQELVVHGMEGFDAAKAAALVQMPADHEVLHMIAIGHRAPAEDLPEPYREREQPNGRRPLADLAFEGAFTPPPLSQTK